MYTIVDGIYTNNIMFVFHCHLLIVVANEYINYLLLNSNIYRRSAFSKNGNNEGLRSDHADPFQLV